MKKLFAVLGVIWLASLLRITVFRNGCFSHGLFSGEVELHAFAFYIKLLKAKNIRYFCYLFFGNIIWFAPAGFLVRLWGGRFWHAAAIGLALSLAVEAGQFILGSGVTELDDLILNTAGACMGYGIGCLVFKRRL